MKIVLCNCSLLYEYVYKRERRYSKYNSSYIYVYVYIYINVEKPSYTTKSRMHNVPLIIIPVYPGYDCAWI